MELLSHEGVAHIDAVDINPAQIHLVSLRKAAAETLARDEYITLLGCAGERETEALSARRRALYGRARTKLSSEAQAFFDQQGELIDAGAGTQGTCDRLLDEVRCGLEEHGLDPIERPAEALGDASWRETFERVFARQRLRTLLGSAMETYSKTYTFAAHFSQRFAAALRACSNVPKRGTSYLLQRAFARAPASQGPGYLSEAGYSALKQRGVDRMQLHVGNLIGQMQSLVEKNGPFDLIVTSDVADWMPVRQARELVRAARESVTEGGAILARRLNGDYHLGSMLSAHFNVDAAQSRTIN